MTLTIPVHIVRISRNQVVAECVVSTDPLVIENRVFDEILFREILKDGTRYATLTIESKFRTMKMSATKGTKETELYFKKTKK